MSNGHTVRYPMPLIAAIVALCAIAAATAVGAEIVGLDSHSTPIVTTVLAFIGPTIVGLLALVKAEQVDRKTDAVNTKVNGHITRLTEAAVNAGVTPEDLPPAPEDLPALPGQRGGNGEPHA